jgi:hypothetical protein
MRAITIAESHCEFRTGLPRGEWTGRDRVYVSLRLTICRGFVPELVAQVMGGGRTWTLRGWRALRLFEALANKLVEPRDFEARGMREAA